MFCNRKCCTRKDEVLALVRHRPLPSTVAWPGCEELRVANCQGQSNRCRLVVRSRGNPTCVSPSVRLPLHQRPRPPSLTSRWPSCPALLDTQSAPGPPPEREPRSCPASPRKTEVCRDANEQHGYRTQNGGGNMQGTWQDTGHGIQDITGDT